MVEYLQVAASFVEREISVVVVLRGKVPEGDPADRTGAVLSTVTVIEEDVVVLPAASRAMA